ncbi:MAG TPA: hypothetical protein VMM78_08840 [Thermomicrobiales bacterium]|nr:hypothetical protein [Thermomicrobiales bacterium]
MQAQTAAHDKQFGLGPIKNVALALGVLATLTVGAATVALTRSDDTASVSQPSAAAITRQHPTSSWRFLEINELPASAVAAPMSAHDIRFLEINELPAAAAAPMSYQDTRFLEINELPVAAWIGTASDIHFWEINQLPGDDARNLAPSTDRLGERH